MVFFFVFFVWFFFFNDTATTEIYTLSLHDALPICFRGASSDNLWHYYTDLKKSELTHENSKIWNKRYDEQSDDTEQTVAKIIRTIQDNDKHLSQLTVRSEEHTSELQSLVNLVCRLLLEKKKIEI